MPTSTFIAINEEAQLSGNGRQGSGMEDRLVYWFQGSLNYGVICSAVNAAVTLGYVPFISANLLPLNNIERELVNPAAGTWKCTFIYKASTESRQTGDNSLSFSTMGGKTRAYYGVDQMQSYEASGGLNTSNGNPIQSAPSYGGLINVDQNGVAQGVEIDLPVFNFRATLYVDPSNMTQAYIGNLFRLTGSVNSQAVNISLDGTSLAFNAGELKFIGAEGQKRAGISDWEISLHFDALPNGPITIPNQWATQTINPGVWSEVFGTSITVQKRGWDYFWLKTAVGQDYAGNNITFPTAWYISQIYYYNDLNSVFPNGQTSLSNGAGNPPTPWLLPNGQAGIPSMA